MSFCNDVRRDDCVSTKNERMVGVAPLKLRCRLGWWRVRRNPSRSQCEQDVGRPVSDEENQSDKDCESDKRVRRKTVRDKVFVDHHHHNESVRWDCKQEKQRELGKQSEMGFCQPLAPQMLVPCVQQCTAWDLR